MFKHHTYFAWHELKIGDRFRVPGFDDLLQKTSETHAKALGSSKLLRKPLNFARKGESVLMATPGSTASMLILAL